MISADLDPRTIQALGVSAKRNVLRYVTFGGIALVGILGIFLFRAGLSPLINHNEPHPSDAALEAIFRLHEADFNQLVEMSNVDAKVVRIAPDFTWLDDNPRWPRPESEIGFSIERWNQYRELFDRLGLRKGLSRYPDGSTIELIASTQGLLTGGSSKGYIHSTKNLSPLYDSLDHPASSSEGKYVYKRLKKNWYLFYYAA
jgi:hypothetical protein